MTYIVRDFAIEDLERDLNAYAENWRLVAIHIRDQEIPGVYTSHHQPKTRVVAVCVFEARDKPPTGETT